MSTEKLTKDHYLGIRLPAATHDQLQKRAASNYRSLSQECRLLLDKALKKSEVTNDC